MNTRLHRPLITFSVLALSIAILAGCFPPADLLPGGTGSAGGASSGGGTPPTGANMPPLNPFPAAAEWQLDNVGGVPAVPGSEATMALAAGTVAGTTGCNRYTGSYTLSDPDGIQFGALAMTQMACAAPIMAQEQAFTNALAATARYSIVQETLTFTDASGAQLATFKPRLSTSLTGPTWVALGINNGKQAVASVVAGTEVTAVFGADGTLSGKAGCNQYSAAYTVDGNKMAIQAPVSTRMFCSEPAGVMEQEQAYLAALIQVATYSIDGDRLQLRSADGALQADYSMQP